MAFGFYRQFTYDPTKVPSDQTNFPVEIAGTFSWAASVANGGRAQTLFDIRPCTTTALSVQFTYQLHSYNATTGAFDMTVLVPTLSASVGNVIYIGIGDAALVTDGSSTSVWDANFKAVYCLGDGTTLSLADSTSNANTLTNTNAVTATAGPFAGMGAGSFNGTTQNLEKAAAIVAADPMTLEMLFNPTNTSVQVLGGHGNSTGLNGVRDLFKNATPALAAAHFGNTNQSVVSVATYATATWQYAAGVYTNLSSRTVQLESAADVTSVVALTSINNANQFAIGCRWQVSRQTFFTGGLGQTRVSNISRARDWRLATRNNLILMPWTVGGEVVVGVKTPFALFQFTHR